ncbi:homoaconitate hydratase family protein/3-isopropylmalate dehydratase, large subunit [Candidatus Methanoperedens nitroreducens]|uniref:3-isopropylmalate dehydratase large subunit n=1 Tax=Candidatus Methanoperedens nitratireducens TaxID=1392998 RepID=A0A062V148_9EURY|nr:3-isopropylmalate dehydratase large subunit [Candidatus Methanoperedens nitroreducens]KCZ70353.1 homoaconitate hydratase family protein/3-isopropylmalate dehydratase, large subunit [Candidatus Methanoperedens nitroreducens]MDJ1420791.1 3-isopropylmalate dehydratase large subunit [Candidatus Methanoperedens sp.]
MAQTISEKIFSKACGKDVKAGDFVLASIDCAMTHDITGPLAVEGFREIVKDKKRQKVWDPDKIVILFDHQVPADSLNAAANHILMRKFASEQGILNYDVFEGVCHQVMPEKGHVRPGDLTVGSDSHTCAYGALGAFSTGIGSTDMAFVFATGKLWFRVPQTFRFEIEGRLPRCVYPKDVILHLIGDVGAEGARYKTAEFCGSTVRAMDIPGRMTMCNMAIEMGGKAGIVEADSTTEKYIGERVPDFRLEAPWKSDEDAEFSEAKSYDVSELSPQVACPHNVDNVKPVEEVEGTRIDQVFVGSCTNGRFEDIEIVAKMMKGEKVAKGVRLLIIPASRTEYMKTLRAGYIEQFMEAGAIVESPCCGPCMGGAFGLLGKGEAGLSTSNRNFKGRQGSPDAFVYLSSPATAAASALYGEIRDPRKI